MYQFDGDAIYKFHVKKYGHPSKFGFKDVINEWKAEDWDPKHLIDLTSARAQNISRRWRTTMTTSITSTRRISRGTASPIGPKKDIVGGWARRCATPACISHHEPRRPRLELVSGCARFRPERPAGRRALRRDHDQGRTARHFGGKASIRRTFTRSITRPAITIGPRAAIRRSTRSSAKNISTASST
jgi:hypothetical protein